MTDPVTGVLAPRVLIIPRPPKHRLRSPFAHWVKRELRYRVDSSIRADGALLQYCNGPAVRATIAEYIKGRRNHHFLLWKLIVLSSWLQPRPNGVSQ
jgi:hypothetical protein